MQHRFSFIFCCLLMLGGFVGTAAAQTAPTATPTPASSPEEIVEESEEVVKVESELVNILFTAADKDRRFLTNLRKEDVRVTEDGQPQEVFAFSRQVDLPLSMAVVIDVSVSQERTLPEEKRAAMQFLENVVRSNKDEVAVLTFTGETTLEQGLTGNVARLRRAVERVNYRAPSGYVGGGVTVGTPPISGRDQAVQGSTALWDAVFVTSTDVLTEAPQGTRRAIILLTDGVDTFSSKKLNDAVDQAIKAEAVIYCIGIGDDLYGGVDEAALKKVAERTGGRAYFPRDEADLDRAFAQIQNELRSQYLLAYAPTNIKKDGSYRTVKIEVAAPELQKQKVKLTHRQGYFSPTEDKK